jgi:hypothetical protein
MATLVDEVNGVRFGVRDAAKSGSNNGGNDESVSEHGESKNRGDSRTMGSIEGEESKSSYGAI